MRIVSLVPSWTETLLEAGLDVVGRTRFCVHPEGKVASIPVVGGTKKADWDKIRSLNPDLLILDREENPKDFADQAPCPWLATHVRDLSSLAAEFRRLGEVVGSDVLRSYGLRCEEVLRKKADPGKLAERALSESWGTWSLRSEPVIYVIWKNPWMAAGPETYIASVLGWCGLKMAELPPGKYPEIAEALLSSSIGLFSSEPYPFAKKPEQARSASSRGAIVDGESFSWFGIRSLRFVESLVAD